MRVRSVEENKRLCEEMPYLIPHNRWTGNVADDYDYTYTELDMCEFGNGWDKLFMDCLNEINPILKKANYLEKFRIVQVKEKWGMLNFYHNGLPKDIYDDVESIINKYSKLSEETCIVCGKPGKMTYCGWISPFCKECWEKDKARISYEEATEEPDYV